MTIQKTSVSLRGHRTSFSLEPEFMALLKAIAKDQNLSLAELVAQIDEHRDGNLSSALRSFVLRAVAELSSKTSPTQQTELEQALYAWLSDNRERQGS